VTTLYCPRSLPDIVALCEKHAYPVMAAAVPLYCGGPLRGDESFEEIMVQIEAARAAGGRTEEFLRSFEGECFGCQVEAVDQLKENGK